MISWAWWLVLGLLAGWLIEWVIDWFYWRQRRQAFAADLAAARADVDRLRIELERANETGQRSEADLASLRESLAVARTDGTRFQTDLKTLNDAAQRDKADLGALRTMTEELRAENDRLRAELDVAQGAARPYQTELGALKLEPEGAPSHQTVLLGADTPAPVATLSAEGLAIKSELARSVGGNSDETARQHDPLIDINGIGPVYEQRLFDAGVYTFADLAAMTPERVREIIKSQSWQDIDPDAWIAEARKLAERRRSVSS